jgi:hypothetical protein
MSGATAATLRSIGLSMLLGAVLYLLCGQLHYASSVGAGGLLSITPSIVMSGMLKGALLALSIEALRSGLPAAAAVPASVLAGVLISSGFVLFAAFRTGRNPQVEALFVFGSLAAAVVVVYWVVRTVARRFGLDW